MIGNDRLFAIGMFNKEALHIKQFLFAFPVNSAQRFFGIPFFENYHIVVKTKLDVGDYGFYSSFLVYDKQSVLFSEFAQKLAPFIHIQSLDRIVKPYFARL